MNELEVHILDVSPDFMEMSLSDGIEHIHELLIGSPQYDDIIKPENHDKYIVRVCEELVDLMTQEPTLMVQLQQTKDDGIFARTLMRKLTFLMQVVSCLDGVNHERISKRIKFTQNTDSSSLSVSNFWNIVWWFNATKKELTHVFEINEFLSYCCIVYAHYFRSYGKVIGSEEYRKVAMEKAQKSKDIIKELFEDPAPKLKEKEEFDTLRTENTMLKKENELLTDHNKSLRNMVDSMSTCINVITNKDDG